MLALLASSVGHVVALGLVVLSAFFRWQLCFMLLSAWLITTLGVAVNLSRDPSLPKLCQVHWLLAALQVFSIGTILSSNAFSEAPTPEPTMNGTFASSMAPVLNGSLLFQSNELMITDFNSPPVAITPSLSSAHSFIEFREGVVFAARRHSQEQLWHLKATASIATQLHHFEDGTRFDSLLVTDDTLLLAASVPCGFQQRVIFQSDGESLSGGCREPGRASLIAQLFFAGLPATLLSGLLLKTRPALFLSLFLGIYSLLPVLRLLADRNLLTLHDFISTSLTIYSGLAYLSVMLWLWLRPKDMPELKDPRPHPLLNAPF